MSDKFTRRALSLLTSLPHACVCAECISKAATSMRKSQKAYAKALQKKYQFHPGLER